MAVWKRLGCHQRKQRTWWQIVATPYTGLAWLWKKQRKWTYLIIIFHNCQAMNTFSSDDRNCGWKNLDGKNYWNFDRIPHNTFNFIIQDISSFWDSLSLGWKTLIDQDNDSHHMQDARYIKKWSYHLWIMWISIKTKNNRKHWLSNTLTISIRHKE